MKTIVPEALEYLKTQRVGVLALEMLDGSPHASTVHFANAEEPFVFYYETYRPYRKAEVLFDKERSRASFVVGTNEDEMKTLQIDGFVELVKPEEKEHFDSVYFAKFPDKKEKSGDTKFVFFKFVPTWWRFTNWNTPKGKKIWVSE